MKKLLSVCLSFLIAMLSIPASALTDEEWYQLRAERDEFYLEEWGVTEERFWISEFGPGKMEKWGDFEVFVQTNRTMLLQYHGTEINVVIPEGITDISEMFLVWNNKIETESITFPESMRNLGYEKFSGMTSLKEVHIPEGVKSLSEVFYACPSLEKINIPSTVTLIGSGTFGGCISLKEIKLPEGLRRIGENAFNGSGLTEITIPASVEVVEHSFHNCKNLKKIVITSPDTKLVGWSKDSIGTATLYVPKGSNAEKTAKKLGLRYVVTGQKTYTVKRGDTLWGISRKYLGAGIRYKEIMELNGLKSTLIHAGKKLYLPEK